MIISPEAKKALMAASLDLFNPPADVAAKMLRMHKEFMESDEMRDLLQQMADEELRSAPCSQTKQ